MFIARFVLGIGIGAKSATVPMYVNYPLVLGFSRSEFSTNTIGDMLQNALHLRFVGLL
jgi:hypothetical protein